MSEAGSHRQTHLIRPPAGLSGLDLKELWAYRELVLVLVERDLRVRYKQTILGAAWALLQPVASMLIFTVVFGKLAKLPSEGVPYAPFVYAGLLPWTFFAACLQRASNSLLTSADMIQKVYFPRLIIPLSAAGAPFADFLVATLLMFVLMAVYGLWPTANLLFLPLVVAGTLMTAVGTGALFSAISSRFRDLGNVLPFMVQLWMYASPVVYSVDMYPERFRTLAYLNPMCGLIDAYRSCFLGKPFDIPALTVSLTTSLGVFILGAFVFLQLERKMADVI